MPRLPRLTGREVARAIERHGFRLSRVRGSHHLYTGQDGGILVVVPIHSGRVIPPGTLANILRQIGIEADTFLVWLRE